MSCIVFFSYQVNFRDPSPIRNTEVALDMNFLILSAIAVSLSMSLARASDASISFTGGNAVTAATAEFSLFDDEVSIRKEEIPLAQQNGFGGSLYRLIDRKHNIVCFFTSTAPVPFSCTKVDSNTLEEKPNSKVPVSCTPSAQ